ncbi:hypothetical protein FB381_3254 [Nocardioides albertanoniae]|uniref:Uncharacterized protein n=1 Tax=Nocardioides albertanoniae TaxID=1175486 RepID=A0A543A9X7_9ACTN|nr:hypothetical protein [Nocardioides albertanoniae]TQL69349.1 hypothetical protein FB381_3254 [Nocardioides albertanoniae]
MTDHTRPGDHVRTHGGVRSGKRGVVVATASGRSKVRFSGSSGATWVRSRNLSLSGGSQLSWIVPVKAALVLFLIVPVARFVVVYLWTHGGLDGFPTALGSQMGQAALAWAHLVVNDPIGALLHLGFLGLVSRLMNW